MNKNMLLNKKRFNVCKIGFAAIVALMFVISAFSFSNNLYAQSAGILPSATVSDVLVLNNDVGHYKLAPYMFITKDVERKLNPSTLLQKHDRGIRGEVPVGDVVSLGMSTDQHWVVMRIKNASWNEDWVLSFGDNFSGQAGYMHNLIIRNNRTKERLVNTVSSEDNPYVKTKSFGGHTVPVNIARGEELELVWLLKSDSSIPLTLSPTLYKASEYTRAELSPLKSVNILNFYCLVFVGLLIGAIVFRKIWMSGIVVAYVAVHAVLFHYQNNFFFNSNDMREAITSTLWVLCVILGLIFTKYFLVTEKDQRLQTQIIVGFSIGLIVSCWVANFFVDRESVGYWLLNYIPAYFAVLFMTMLSFAQARNNSKSVFLYAMGWLFYFIGMSITHFTLLGLFPPKPFLIAMTWIMFIPQGVFFMAAIIINDLQKTWDEELQYKLTAEEQQAVKSLKKTKEEAEISRLVRLVEHERVVMNELREREMVQNEEMKNARDAAEEADRAKSAFLAVVSHEIRTPMTGIMGMVKLLQETSLTSSQKDYALTIQDSGDAMMALLNDILDFEKIESGKLELEYLDFDLNRLLRGVVTLMSGHAETKSIWLKLNVADGVPAYVIGDPVRLRQVLLNLVGNAIKFTAEGGVTLKVEIDPTQKGDSRRNLNQIRFSVEDTGIGISQEAQRNLFNPFSQADSSITRKFGGTGLGLAICRRLIEAMGGEIAIDSTEGHGSTFFFSVLLEEGSAKAAESIAQEGSIGAMSGQSENKQRILIVDDNEINQKLLKELVTRLGHEIDLAGSGEEALTLVRNKPFDMVLMDIQLPGISGMEATKSIRAMKEPEKANIPVIALTGNVSDSDIRACLQAEMNAHLEKPVDPLKLKKMIMKVEQGEFGITPSSATADKEDASSGSSSSGSSSSGMNYIDPAQAIRQGQDVMAKITESGGGPQLVRSAGVDDADEAKAVESDPESPSAVAPIRQFVHGGGSETPELSDDNATETDDVVDAPALEGSAGLRQAAAQSSETIEVSDDVQNADSIEISDAESKFGKLSEEDLDEDSFSSMMELSDDSEDNSQNSSDISLSAGEAAAKEYDGVFSDHVLKDLVSVMPEPELRQLVDGFFDKADEIVTRLNEISAEDVTDFKARVHELKGMAGNFGFVEIHELAEQAEKMSEQDNMEGAMSYVPQFSEAKERAKTALDQWLSDVSAA